MKKRKRKEKKEKKLYRKKSINGDLTLGGQVKLYESVYWCISVVSVVRVVSVASVVSVVNVVNVVRVVRGHAKSMSLA